MITTDDLRGMVKVMAKQIDANRAELNKLDAELGDGDHGTTIATGFQVVATDIDAAHNPAEVMSITAKVLMNRMGGSSGALFGTLFLRAAMTIKDQETISPEQFGAMFEAGSEGVMKRGKAQPGDKTMVDALAPAAEALKKSITDGHSLEAALAASAQAATKGAEATTTLQAKYGRAKFVGERAIGHMDAGAKSIALMFEAMHTYWKENHNGEA